MLILCYNSMHLCIYVSALVQMGLSPTILHLIHILKEYSALSKALKYFRICVSLGVKMAKGEPYNDLK